MYSSQETCKIQKKKKEKQNSPQSYQLEMCCSHFISSNGTTLCISNNAINQYLLKTYFELIRSFINTF